MLRFRLFDIPVTVQPWLLLTALLIGPKDLRGAAMWVPVVVIGILAHELGHALAVRRFGLSPTIQLHGFGGTTAWRGGELSPARRIAVTAAGPAVGITIGLLTWAVMWSFRPWDRAVFELLWDIRWVNLGWGLLNLLPILPLDGGVIVTTLAEVAVGQRGRRVARVVSLVACIVLAGVSLAAGWWWSAFVLGLLAVSNYQAMRATTGTAPPPPTSFPRP